ncbi:MAG TPA: glycosyltransferase family 1 protein [Firmicutes bacterium]|nr:glycosyltransferase family 1 protein [Bacillota bacterium]
MRVALFSDTFEPQVNGVVNTVKHLLDTFAAQGVEHCLFAPAGGGWRVPFYPELELSWPDYRQVERKLDAWRPDLIHVVTEFGVGWTGRRYALRRGVPLVSSFHTDFPLYLEKYGFPALVSAGWEYLRAFHAASRKTYCPSRDTQAKLRAHGFRNLALWSRGVTPLPADLTPDEIAGVRRRYALDGRLALLYVGRLSREKDLPVLLAAYGLLRREFGETVRLLVVGDGPLRSVLEGCAPSGTVFTGYLRGRELAAAYAAADVFAFPSASETFGNAVLEAMSAGLPVVAPAAGGVTENLVPEHNGLACRPGDIAEFAAALRRLVLDPEERARLGKNARAWAAERSWAAVNGALLASYRQVIAAASKESQRGKTAEDAA